VLLGEDRTPHCALRSQNIMESGGQHKAREGSSSSSSSGSTVYRIVVREELSDRYAVAFEGMEMKARGGQTVLTGEIIDQPQLHGILTRIGSLGLKLVSVETISQEARTR
jgi:hypothetical protein